MVAERLAVKRVAALGGAVDRLEVVDRDAEVVVARRLATAAADPARTVIRRRVAATVRSRAASRPAAASGG
jgi:hypothetical protein